MAEQSAHLAGKVTIVTGAAHGIGYETARLFLQKGAKVMMADIVEPSEDGLPSNYDEGQVQWTRCDVALPDQVEAMIETTESVFGRIDVLVNNAALGSSALIEDLTVDEWHRVFDINVGGVLAGIKYAVPVMRNSGGGSIVNVSSIAAHRAMRGMSAYAAAKAGVEALTRSAALELRADGIRVNAVAPAMIRSQTAERSEQVLASAIGTTMGDYLDHRQGRWGEPREVAQVIAHLASAEASFTSGQTYVLDNGASILL